MSEEEKIRTDIEFAIADAQWRYLLNEHYGDPAIEDKLTSREMKGEPNTPLRTSYDQRQAALLEYRKARGV